MPAYDPTSGRLTSVATAHGTIGVGYDPQGRVSAVSAAEESLGYGYDGFLMTSESFTGAVPGTVGYGGTPTQSNPAPAVTRLSCVVVATGGEHGMSWSDR